MKRVLILLLLILPMWATETADRNTKDDVPITVPRKYVSSEGLSHEVPLANNFIGIGREIGIATKEGLNAVVDVSERFGATNVGRFVMLMIAWRVMGHDLLRVIIGIPIWLGGVWFWVYLAKRFFFGYRVLKSHDAATKTKVYEDHPAYKFDSTYGSGKESVGAVLIIGAIVWVVFLGALIF